MYQQATEQESQRNQGDVINRLFSQHYKASLQVAYRLLGTKEDAEDAVQTAYGLAFRNLHQFRSESKCSTWLTRIVVNCCLTQLRERRLRPRVLFDDGQSRRSLLASPPATPETLCYLREVRAAHQRAVSRLPQHLLEVYEPCVIGGTEFATVARRLGLTAGATKSRLFRARKKVAYALQAVVQRKPL